MCANPVCIPPKTPKGTIAPLDDGSGHGNVHTRIRLPAWMPEWLDLNFMVPLIATVVVVAVGICVVCVALSRRRADDMRGGQKDVYCRFSPKDSVPQSQPLLLNSNQMFSLP